MEQKLIIEGINSNYLRKLKKLSLKNIHKNLLALRTRLTVCCKQTRFSWWLAVVLLVAILLTGLY